MGGDGIGFKEAWVEVARERLRSGAVPAVVCGELAARTRWWWDAVLAVGRAMGISESEMRQRLRSEPEHVQREFHAGEEELYGELLAMHGVFDIPMELDEREMAIAEHLRIAMRAQGGVASGHALDLSRGFVTGELACVFRSLSRLGPRSTRGRPAEFWAALVAAGELLDPVDGDERGTVPQALDECRRQLADGTRSEACDS